MLSLLTPASTLWTEDQGERQKRDWSQCDQGGGRAFRNFLEVPSVMSAYFLCMLGFMYGARDLTEAALGV